MSTNPNPINTSANPAPRCQHRFANFKQCRLPASAPSPFCPQHAKFAQPLEEDHSRFLLKSSQDFQTAQGVNFALANLFELVAKNRISSRRAAVLAYIGSLLLRTHSAIDHDRELNITDPTKSQPKQSLPSVPEPDPAQRPS
ncbi:MAG: hypothetical protein JSS69_12835 [Acidobacteria bacterium]|nr:hypothetical protein [Acidobacteriota bacterium]MBS1866792.1 hypothetical protein [Acidobacteriota bacterium]